MTGLMALWLPGPVRGATLIWDGGTNSWSGAFWNGGGTWTGGAGDIAQFGGTAGTVTLGAPITAGGLIFNTTGYTVAGGGNALTFAGSPTSTIAVNGIGTRATVDAQISGSAGLTKTGNGVLVLSNNSNNFTGNVLVNQGALVVTNESQLGSGNLVSVNGFGGVNFSGGSLVFQGGLAGSTLSKNLSLSGRAQNYANSSSAALFNIGGNNTLSGNIAFSNASPANIASAYGKLNLTGTIGVPTGSTASLLGNGNYIVSGLVTGGNVSTDRFVKAGTNLATTLWLQNNSNNYVSDTRIDSGTIRVSSNGALGLSTSTTAIDLNGGALEIHTDAPDFSGRNVRVRDNTNSTIFASRALGGSGVNQTVVFGRAIANGNANLTANSRDGYAFTFGDGVNAYSTGGANNSAITSNATGLVTINAPILYTNGDGTARTFTVTSTGDMLATGNILRSAGGDHLFTKAGNGTFTLQGTAGTFTGSANVNAGTLNISTIGALNATSTGRVVFGGGTLNYTGAGETWTNKVLLLNATNNILTNNGTGALVLPQNVANNATGTKTLVLGGSNSAVNDITGIIAGTTLGAGVTKIGSGTWQITAPGTATAKIGTANASYAVTGIAASTNGTQTITTTNTAGLVVGQPVSGAGVAFGTVISQIISGTQFAVSQAVATTGLGAVGTSVNLGTVTGSTAALTVTASTTANLLTVASTANLVPGQYISGTGLAAADGWYVSQINSGTTFTVANSTNTAALAVNAAVGTQNPLASPNFGGALTISNGTLRLNSTAAGTGSDVVNNGSPITFNTDPITAAGSAGGILDYRGFTGGSSETLGRLTVSAGNSTVRITPVGGTNVLTFGSIAAPAVGSSLNFDVPGSPGTNSIVISKGTTAGLLNAHAYYNGADFAFSPAGPNATLSAPVYGTTPTFSAVNTLTAASNVAINTNASTGALAVTSLKISGDNALSLTGALTVGGATGGGILVDGATTGATISGTGVTTNSAGDLTIRVNGASDILTLSAPVTATTTGGITKNGAGNLILSGTNLETGTVTINEGKITLSGTGTLGSNNVNLTLRQGTTLDVNGVTTSNVANFQGAGTVTNSAASGTTTLVVGNNNGSQGYFSGTLQDGATAKIALTKTGTGNIAIGGAQNYSGQVNLNGGALLVTSLANIGQASGLGKGDATSTATNQSSLVFNGGTLVYTGANTSGGTAPLNVNIFQQTQTPSVSIDRLFTLAGSGTIDSSGSYGNNTLARAANNAALIFNNTGAVAFTGTGTRNLTFQGDSTGDNEFKPIIGNNPNAGELTSVTKAGGGLWHLTGVNTYTGQTIINGGALQATEGVGIPTNSAISFTNTGGGVFQSSGTSPVTFNRALGTTGNTIGWTAHGSGGFSAGSTPLTVTIAGNPTWGSTANFLGTGNLILNSSTAFADVTLNSDFGIAAGVAATPTLTTTANSATVNFATGSTVGLTPGQAISNANLPAGSFIVSINSPTQVTISNGTGVVAGTGVAGTVTAGGFRQIQVNDNSNTGLDYANVTGIISGTGGLATSGAGTLILGAANTYSGGTFVNNGNLVVQSIGTGGASSSLGNASGALNIGLLGTSGTVLYVGTGETTTRTVNLAGTTGGATISADGSGPLVLTALSNAVGGAKTLTLRGLSIDANAITSNLNDNGGALTVTKTDGGNWELSGTNGFTGNLNLNGGLLGANGNAALGANGTGNVIFNNGGIYSTNAAGLTITRAVQITNNAQASFTGSYPITVSSNIQGIAGNPWTINNTITSPTGLTISGNFNSAEATTQARTLAIQGTGNTTLSGVLQGTGAANGGVGLIINTLPTATTTITGASANLLSSGGELRSGILILDKAQALGLAAATFDLNGGELRTSSTVASQTQANAFRLNGSAAVINGTNPLTMSGSLTNTGGNRILQNSLSGGAQLTIAAISLSNDNTGRTFTLSGSGTTNVTGIIGNGGTGAGALTYNGNGNLNLTGANTFTGAATFSGGTTTVSGAGLLGATGALAVNQATLTLDNSGTQTNNRLGGRALTLTGATLNILGNAAAGGTEGGTPSTLTIGSGGSTINTTNLSGTNTLGFTTLTINTGGSINFTGGVGTATNQVTFSTAPTLSPVTTGILARATVGGADFATYGGTGIAAFSAYANPANLNSAAATDTVRLNGTTTVGALTTNKTVNALAFDAGSPTVSNTSGTVLTVTSGGILATGGSYALSARTNLGAEGALHVNAGSTLTISGALSGTAGLNKNLGGALNLNTPNFVTGTTTLNAGTTTLGGGLNTIFPGQTLVVNPGATLDLNGNSQYVQAFGGGNNPGTGGTITSSGAALFTNNGNVAFGGAITGAITMNKTGSSTLTAESPLNYTGPTWITGGTLTLRDNATLLNTSAVNLNFATLILDSNANLQIGNNNRLSDTAPINSRGGVLTYQARFGAAGTETVGAFSLLEGASTINVNAANNAGNNTPFLSADLTIPSLSRNPGTTLNMTGSQAFGTSGNANHLFFTTAPSTLSNGMLGAWAIANTTDYAAYDTTLGVGAFGYAGYRGYDATFASGNVTQFINNAPSVQNLTGATTTTSALRLGGVFTNDVTFSSGTNVLNLEVGGLLRSNQAAGSTIGTLASRGVLTAGGTESSGVRELVIYNASTSTGVNTGAIANTTSGSPIITGLTTPGLQVGMTITNGAFAAGTKILSIDGTGQITVSNNANATNTGNQTITTGNLDGGVTNVGSNVVTVNSTIGLTPGMIVTNANLPAGSYITAVTGPTSFTVSQNATANASTQTIVGNFSNVIVNSVIADNGFGNSVTLLKSGAGVLNLSANNTYTGGTIINQGTVNLIGSGVVIPAGGITLNGATLTMATNAGQIAASNAVTLNASSTLTLAGNNTLASLSFDNSGGTSNPAVNTGGVLTLTGASPISVISNNVATVPTISGTVNLTAGAKTFSTGANQIGGQAITTINPSLNISAVVNGIGTSINKTGNGLLQFSGQNTFTDGIDLQAGGLIVGASSTPAQGGAGITSGPFGSGAITAASGTTFVANSTASFGNAVAFAGTPTFDATANTVWTLTLNGAISGAGWSGAPTVQVSNPNLTVALLGNLGALTNITKTGPGILVFNSTNYSGNYDAAALGNELAVSLLHDGTAPNIGNGVVETISVGSLTFAPVGTGTVTVGRAGGSLPFNQAQNKIIAPSSINTVLTNGLTVANNNGYGLSVSDAGALVGGPNFTVNTATASNVTQGLILTGALSGSGFNKLGAGTLVLTNAGNTFNGNISINQGVLSVSSDAQLGAGGNNVRLNPTTGTSTLRATGNITTSRVIDLFTSANTRAIEVTGGNTLQLNTAFGLTGGLASALIKADAGTLALNANNSTWTGVMTISQGAVNILDAGALGTTAGNTVVSASGAALQLPAGISLGEPLTLNGTGLFTAGALQGTGSGTSIQTGAITLAAAAAIGADAGNTLSIRGGASGAFALTLAGAGNTEFTTTAVPVGLTNMTKIGSGTSTMGVASPAYVGTITVNRGTFQLGSAGVGSVGGTGLITVNQNGTFTIDNTVGTPLARTTNRGVTLAGGTLNYNNGSTTFTDTSTGALTLNSGSNVINMSNTGGVPTNLVFGSLAFGAGGTGNVNGLALGSNLLKFGTTTPTLTPATTGLFSRLTVTDGVNGNEFATYNGLLAAGNGVVPFTAYAPATNILSAGATQTYKATPATSNSLTGNQTLNALNLLTTGGTPNVGGLGGLNPTTLTLTSGAILVNGTGTNAILSVPIVALGAAEGVIHTSSGKTLDVTSGFSGTAGMTKALNGTLNLNAQQFVSGTTTVNGGTLNLQSASTNTLLFNTALTVNTGGTVDLKNGVQFIGSLASQGAGASTDIGGGIVTNSGAQATLVTNSNSSFGGSVQGTVYLNKTGTSGLTLTNPNSFTGDTLITGGTLTLVDSGTLGTPGTGNIGINFGSLTLTNTGLLDNADRVSLATITMKGGNINFNGRAQTNSTEALGAVILADGYNSIINTAGGTGINSSILTLDSLTRSVGSTATLRLTNGNLGTLGSFPNIRISGAAPALTNNIVGPWAINDREFLSYDSTYGLGSLNASGFAGYAGSGLNTSPLATDNVRQAFAGGTTTLLANTVVNTLNISQTATSILDLGANTLRVQGGGMIIAVNTNNSSMTINNGTITSGTVGAASDFYLHVTPYDNNTRTTVIGAAIADNAPGTGPVRLIVSLPDNNAASTLTLSGTNTYTGGTIINQGPVVLGATGTLGTGGITVNGPGSLTQTLAGVIPSSNTLTLGGSSTVTLANQANSLAGLVINNLGGSAPTLTPTGTLTLTGGTTVSTVNAGAVATIGTGTLDLNAAGAYSINVGATVVNGQDVAPWQAGLIINSVIQNGGISKSGAGVLQLGGASTFAGGVNVTAGGLIIGSDTNSLLLNDLVVTGPVGTGTLTMGANTTLLAGGAARTITNNVTFLGDSVFNGTNNLTLNGTTTLPSIWNATVTAPQMTVTIGDATPSIVTDEINKSGLGTLVVGNYAGTINATGGLLFTGDGNTLSTLQSIALGGALVIAGDTALTVNRSGGAPNARNKTLQKASLSNAGSILSVNNLSGYGLEITGGTSLTAASHFAVGVATASNVIQGLTLSGVVSDTGGFNLVKSGAGTLALTNAGNTFGGVGTTIDVLAGVLAANSDGALGNSNNSITLNVDGSTGVGFRATGTFSTARSFILNQANNAFEVTAGNLLTLTNAFSLPLATNTLSKNDNGVLAITADNTGWNGAVAINAGAIRVGHANALGAGAVTVNNSVGSALQLDGVSFGSPVTLFSTGASGINSAGVIQATSGTSTLTGTITQTTGSAVTIGADAGATLNINGTFATSNSTTFNVGSGGVINLNTAYGNGGTGGPIFAKFGAGTLNVTVNQPAVTSAINVNQGTLNVSGSGVTLGLTGLVSVNASGTLTLNDTAATAARLGNRAVTIQGGTVNYLGSTSTETSTGALTFARMGGIYNQTASTSATVTFGSLALGTDASANFTGSGLGTASNRLLFTTAPTLVPATTGILARATVNGADFATYGANGLAAFTAYQNSNNPNTAAATDTMNLTANAALTANRTLNSVKISGGTQVTLSGAAFNQLTLTAGGVLATGATTHIMSVPVLANAAVQDIFHVDSGSTLNVTSTLTGTAGLVKDGAGTLTIGSPASNSGIANVNANTLSGTLTVARGTLTLNGGTNTYAPGQFLVMGGPAATLDLNGTSQQISGLLTDTATPGSGGSIIGTAGSQLVINQDNNARTFAGSIGGAVNLVRSGQNTLTLVSPNTYTGTTLINGNTTILQSGATLSGTSAVDLNYATLTLDNSGLNDSTDRINDAASIALRGSTLTLTGRAQTASSEVLGAVSIAQGFNVINSNAGGTGVNSADLSLASLSRPGGSSATFFANGTNLGTIGSNGRIAVTTLNGVATTNPAYSANGSGLTNNLVGGWAISNNDFLTYIPGLGLAPLNQTGATQYDLTNTFVGGVSTDNVRLTATTTIPNGGSNINAVSMTGAAINIAFATGTDTLNITSGGLIGPNNNQTIGATLDSGRITAGGLTPAANSDLYVYNRANTLTINSRIIDNTNGGSSSVRSVFTASGGIITLVNPNNSYTGGTVLNGGTLNLTNTAATAVIPAGGLTINGGTVTMNNFAGQINAANVVTLNGAGSTLNLWGDNTLAGLVFNNNGGGSGNNAVNTFSQAATAGAAANGVLTVGASGIVATSSNIASNSYIIGRTDFGATNKTIQVDAVSANSVDINPLFAGLNIQGIVGSTGGFTKTGAGVLALQAQAHYTGPTTVTNGTLRIAVTNAGSRLSALTLGAGTYLNLANASTTWGSLAGSGTIFASAGTPTLTVGFNNDATTTFSGQLARFNDAVINGISLQKVGTGELVMTSAQSFATGTTGTITVNGGSLRYRDAGAAFPGTAASGATTLTVNNGGTLALDNTGTTSVNNRLGLNVIGTLNLQGGRLAINAGSTTATPVTELVTTFNVTNGGGRIELTPDAVNPVTLTLTTLNTANGNGTLVVGGIDGSVAGTAGKAALVITTPNLLGGQGGGANGTTTMSVRHDILGDASVSGLGTGFLVRDTAVGGTYRALASGELASAFALPLTTDVDLVTAGNQAAGALNVGLTGSAATIGVNTVANTLTISGTSSIGSSLGAAFGNYGPGGNLLTTSLSNAAASLTLAGATGTINTAFGSTTTGTTPFAHVIAGGTLNVNGAFGFSNAGTTGTAGLAKADGGTMNLNNKAYYTGTTSVNNGTLNLNSGSANTLAVVPTAGGATVSQLNLNGTTATVDLKGQNQAFGALTSVNPLPGQGGTLTNTGAAATVSLNGTGTFGGSITGALALTRSGNTTTTLTNANTYTGATIVRGGTLQLRDSGTISSTAGLTLNYGTLNWDNFGLNAAGTPNPTRIAATNPVTMQGGTFTVNGAGSTDTTATLNSVTVTGGNNTFNVLPYVNMGGTVKLTIGNLVRNTTNRSGVNFNGFTTNNAGTGVSSLGGQGLTQNGNIILNQINGASFTASNLVNNLIGGWAVADGSTFATYVNGFGVSVMGQTTQGIAAPGFTGTDVSAALVATGNYNDGSNRTLAAGAVTANSLRFGPGANQTITFPTTTTLSLGTGIITNANFTTTLAATDATNTLTGSGTDLYFYVNQSTVAVQPAIVGTAALVSNGPATLSLRPTFASNTYSGGTFVNAGTLNLQAGGAFTVIPGDLTINNAAVTMSTTQVNQIAATSNVFINGGGSLTFPNYSTGPTQTLASLTFTNDGGTGNPSLSLGTPTVATSTLILSSATPITSTNNSLATTPTISTGAATLTALQFSNANPVLTVNDGLAETELAISAPITQNVSMLSLSKTGAGVLALSGASTFSTGFNLNQGSLMFGANSAGTLPTITSGPVGTGTLTIAGGTSLLSDGTARTVGNATTVNGDFTFSGVTSGNGVTLSGAMNLGAAGRTITVTSPAVTSTISGAITSTAASTALTKAGPGILVLSSTANNFNGQNVAVTGGVLKNGAAAVIPDSSGIAVSAGAGWDLNNFDETVDRISGSGFITQSGATTKTLTVSSTTNSSTFAGSLTDNSLGVTGSRLNLAKTGAGTTLTLSGVNTYTGTTVVNSGTLQMAAQTALYNNNSLNWTAANINVKSGATLAFNVGGTDEFTAGNVTTLLTNLAASSSATNGMNLGSAIGFDTTNATGGSFTVTDVIANTTGTSGGARSLSKLGAGTLVAAGANTYTGPTNVSAGTLQVANGTTGSLAATSVTVVRAASTIGTDAPVLSGGAGSAENMGTVGVIAGSTIIGDAGNNANRGVLSPGTTLTPGTSNQTLTFTAASPALTVAGGSQLQLGITGATSAADSGIVTALATGTYTTAGGVGGYIELNTPVWVTGAPGVLAGTSYGQYDFINATTGSISLGARNGALGNGTVSVINNGYTAQLGDVFNLLDWQGLMGGTFSATTSGNFTSGGAWDDMDLPSLTGGLVWDTSAFSSHGVLIVVPEPSRALLLLFGLLGLMMRRRRQAV